MELKLAAPENGELIVRQGEALPLKEPRVIKIKGQIDSPFRWIQKRMTEVNPHYSHIIVDREKMNISLIIGDRDYYQSEVSGSLQLHPAFNKFGINSGKYITTHEMAELIKMNRTFFENFSISSELVSALKNLKAQVEKNVEKSDNGRGDRRQIFEQTVKTNVPETFKVFLPVFKGQEKQLLTVEVYFKPEDMTCTLISPEANDVIASTTDSIIQEQLDKIGEIHPELTIIEI